MILTNEEIDRIWEGPRIPDQYQVSRMIESAVLDKLAAGVSVEPVGSVYVSHFRGSKAMQNHDFDYWGDLTDGSHQLVTLDQLNTAIAAARCQALTECAWLCDDIARDYRESLDGGEAHGVSVIGCHIRALIGAKT